MRHTATGTATGVGWRDPGRASTCRGTTHTNAGSYRRSVDVHRLTGNYNDASGTVDDAIAKADTNTALSSSVSPSVFGQSVTLTATVTPVAPGAGHSDR